MGNVRSVGVVAVFVVGCAVGGASSRLVVPPASAQQAATLTKWDALCFKSRDIDEVQQKAKEAGSQGWELATLGVGDWVWVCLKRPKL